MTIFTITYNEELMLPIFVQHYRNRFPNCNIVVYDNYSTDNTVLIAKSLNCEVIQYDTGNKLSDTKYLEIKNNCWKDINGWVIVADCDELLDIDQLMLINLDNHGCTLIQATGYNMVNFNDDLNIESIVYGVRAKSYDKTICFNAAKIKEINYGPGAHSCSPIGLQRYTVLKIKLWHYKYINIDYMIKRHAEYGNRLSDENIKKGYGAHYLYTPEQITNEFNEAKKNAIKIK